MIVAMLGKLIAHNDMIPTTLDNLSRFHSISLPSIGVEQYLQRIVKYGSISKTSLLCFLVYIDRVCTRHPTFIVSSLTVHRFLLVSLTVSTKAMSDAFLSNAFYAKVGGLSPGELTRLEFDLIALLDWDLNAKLEVLQSYYESLKRHHGPLSADTRIPPVLPKSSVSPFKRRLKPPSTSMSFSTEDAIPALRSQSNHSALQA
ncbi:hypothetical protein HDU91_000312 [Kappamyces sp. JEL0680]|nr:hypothetical protein HDU91_000312 [Kappamyces sp. JEL0680]